MTIFKKAEDIKAYLKKHDKQAVGFVPTMGALHDGHISLIDLCRQQSDMAISSIFVNPTQFNDPADFKKYPITLDIDLEMLEKNKCDIVFIPPVEEIYPHGTSSPLSYNLGHLETILEGKHRPGHFQGVCQVVDRLLSIVNPATLYLGQKDYQQCMVIERLVSITGKNTKIVKAPIKRGSGGLALSSRNALLSEAERLKAESLHQCLQSIKNNIKQVAFPELEKEASDFLLKSGFTKVDYVTIANANDLHPVENWDGKMPLVIAGAAYMGSVRLIDNVLINP